MSETTHLTDADIRERQEYADDMGFETCTTCHTVFMPAPGFVNDGHQCGEDGTQDKFASRTRTR